MPNISIKNMEYEYNEGEVINFTEGLIGLPKMRRAVVIPMSEYQPFCWLASLDDEKNRFIVVNPHEVFSGYDPEIPPELSEKKLQTLAIVKSSLHFKCGDILSQRGELFLLNITHFT